MEFKNTLAFAQQLDKEDPLRSFRDQFYIPLHNGKEKIYFDGNSTGLQPKSVKDYVLQELEDWQTLGGDGHFEARRPWYPYHEFFTKQLCAIIGCLPEEVVAMNSLTVNIHLLLVSFYRPTKQRYKIICESKAFPSDQYALESQVKHHGFNPETAIIEVKPGPGTTTITHTDILNTIKEHKDSLALVYLGGINYYTGQAFNMKEITKAAHDAEAYAGFDLAHAAGNIELQMHDWNADFACWCTYKYLNSGPGSVGGIYIHQRHATNKNFPRFAGWWGYIKDTRFRMEKGFDPIPTAEGWQLSNAPVLSLAAHMAALDVFDKAGLENVFKKRTLLTGYLIYVLDEVRKITGKNGPEVITPREETGRGSQVSFIIKEKGRDVYDKLIANGVTCGWREPEVIRVAPVPLYNSFEEVWQFGDLLRSILQN
ncbi:MAG TPA: kynureninase [Chitinophagaceae bacterium]|nr:kynureninase [Chitinophagaceae bacterium]